LALSQKQEKQSNNIVFLLSEPSNANINNNNNKGNVAKNTNDHHKHHHHLFYHFLGPSALVNKDLKIWPKRRKNNVKKVQKQACGMSPYNPKSHHHHSTHSMASTLNVNFQNNKK
jgi:hypothetical protein